MAVFRRQTAGPVTPVPPVGSPAGDPPAAAPVPPSADSASSGNSMLRWIRLSAFVAALLLAVTVAAVVLAGVVPPSVTDLQRQAGLMDKQVLRVGVSGDVPRISQRQPGGSYTGFDVDMAFLVAKTLGFEPRRVEFY